MEPLLTSRQVAEILGLPVRTLDHFAYQRIGPPFFKIGKHRRYHPSDMQNWVMSQRAD